MQYLLEHADEVLAMYDAREAELTRVLANLEKYGPKHAYNAMKRAAAYERKQMAVRRDVIARLRWYHEAQPRIQALIAAGERGEQPMLDQQDLYINEREKMLSEHDQAQELREIEQEQASEQQQQQQQRRAS